MTSGAVSFVFVTEMRAQEPLFRADARDERRDKECRQQHADPER